MNQLIYDVDNGILDIFQCNVDDIDWIFAQYGIVNDWEIDQCEIYLRSILYGY